MCESPLSDARGILSLLLMHVHEARLPVIMHFARLFTITCCPRGVFSCFKNILTGIIWNILPRFVVNPSTHTSTHPLTRQPTHSPTDVVLFPGTHLTKSHMFQRSPRNKLSWSSSLSHQQGVPSHRRMASLTSSTRRQRLMTSRIRGKAPPSCYLRFCWRPMAGNSARLTFSNWRVTLYDSWTQYCSSKNKTYFSIISFCQH